MVSAGDDFPILRAGETCWRKEQASRMSVIVDADAYFRILKTVIPRASHSVMFIGWDFDTRISLDPEGSSEGPDQLGRFLKWAVKQRPDLQIRVLKWDLGVLETLRRGSTPLAIFGLMTSRQISIKLDHAHPSGSAHHQKVVVIDDKLAFCGGIDVTAERWDTRAHRDEHEARRRPTSGRSYGPWHDATTAVDGDAARALGDLARARWKSATGEDLEPSPESRDLWPEMLEPTFTDTIVAISRTLPRYRDREGIHEIEALKLAAIRAARRTLYIESQYFASRKIVEAIAERLKEEDGPEIVIVNPESADGWLESEVMDSARALLLRVIRSADRFGRFRIYTPVAEKGTPIYVHAKIMVMDDRLLRVGSSNLNNRSLGFDSECDLSVEACADRDDADDVAARITGVRNDLLAEHLHVSREDLAEALERFDGSLIATIEALRRDTGSLVPFEPEPLNDVEELVLAENDLLDPERPRSVYRSLLPDSLLSR
jgi:phospholipase D1/2